jgi:hypothetical protein
LARHAPNKGGYYMFRLELFLLALLTITHPVFAQSARSGIEQLSARQISVDHADRPHVESHIAVDPKDPKHLLATAMVFIDGDTRVFPYVSFDGGKTWARGEIIGDSSITGTGAGDPVIYITGSGVSYFSTLAKVNGINRGLVARSSDGGRTWRTTTVFPFTDRQWLAVDVGRGPFGGRTYFTGTGVYQSRDGVRAVAPYLARSDDEGLTFPFRTLVAYDRAGPNPAAPLNAVPMEPLVTPRGLLVLTLQGAPDQQTIERAKRDSLNAWAFGLMISDDGGESFGPARYSPTARLSVTGNARRRLRSLSAGGFVRTAIDASSSRFGNRIYFVSTDYDPTIDRYVVRLWHTGDFGKTWGTAVASDAPRGDVANPAIAVNREGIVAVTWNDRRDDPKEQCWRLYSALSLDGGEHFLPAQRLSQAPTCASVPENWQLSRSAFNSDQSGQYLAHFSTYPPVPTRYPMGGDTQGLVADATGVFHAAWINGETGVMQLWYTAFKAAPALVAELRSRTSTPTDASAVRESMPQGMEEVTHDVRFVVTETNLDFTKRTYNVTIEIENQSARPLRGPLRAVMQHFLDEMDNGHGLKNLAVANADSGGRGIGAIWIFEVPGGILAPGARTKSRVLLFTFEGGIPEFPEGYLAPGFRVYGGAE